MPSTTNSIFAEPDDFQAASYREGSLSRFVTVHGQFRARLTQIALDDLHLSAVEEQLPSIGFLEVPAAKLLVSFPMGDQPAPVWGGISLRKGEFMIFGPGYRGHMRTQGHCRWGAIWFHAQELAQYFRVLTEHTLTIPLVAQRWHFPPAPRRCLLQLHAAAIRIAKARPETFLSVGAAHGLEQEVIEALVECLSAGRAVEETPATRRYQEIMLRFEDLLGAQPSRHMRVDELSAATGVSVRVLRMCSKKVLGMSPTSYVQLHALYRVRHVLRAQNPDATSVAQAARSQGFRALGRFAATYRSLFGELPSSRLRGLASVGS